MIILRNKQFINLGKGVSKELPSEVLAIINKSIKNGEFPVKLLRSKKFSKIDDRENVPPDILEKAKVEGVIQKDHNGDWRIVAIKKRKFWTPKYTSRANAESALKAYQANKH